MSRQRALAMVAVLLAGFAAVLISGFGPSLPGPKLRERVGLVEAPPKLPSCTPRRRRVRTPRSPAPAPGSWRREPSSPDSRAELKAAALDGRVYLTNGQGPGGVPQSRVSIYEPAQRRFGRAPDSPRGLDHAVTVPHAGDLYVVGGYVRDEPTGQAWRYSPARRRWSRLPPLRLPRGGLDGAVIGGRLFVVGGAPRTFPNVYAEPYATLEIYDFERRRWSPGPDMPTARHHLAATALGGKLYVLGGRTPTDFSESAFERFDPKRGRWEDLPPLPVGVADLAAVAANGEVIAIGGDEEEGWERGKGWSTPAVWAFSPRRGSWRRLPDLRVARHGHGAAIAERRLYVFEGSPCPGFSRMDSVESIGVGELKP